MTGDFSVTVDPYLWKKLKNDDDDVFGLQNKLNHINDDNIYVLSMF